MSETIEEKPEQRPLLGSTPKFTPPSITDLLAARLDDPGKARVHWGMSKNPGEKWLIANADILKAVQREVNDYIETLDIRPFLDNAAKSQIGEDQIEELHSRVRVPKDAQVGEMIRAALQGNWTRKIVMMCPLHKPIEPWVHWNQLALMRKQPWLGYDQVTHASLPYARNMLAKNFLETEAEWSFWYDGDTAASFGEPAPMYSRFGAREDLCKPESFRFHVVDRLMSRKKTIIGAVVGDRHPGNRMVIQPEFNPRNEQDTKLVKELKQSGPQDKVYPVSYCGTGCLLVHRSVYLDIMAKRPEFAPAPQSKEPFNFFNHGSGANPMGEDMAFCKLAAECGHPSFLDLSVWCAHVGPHAYFPQRQI